MDKYEIFLMEKISSAWSDEEAKPYIILLNEYQEKKEESK